MDRSKAPATSAVPDRLLIHAVRWVPAMMVGGFGAIAWAVFGQGSAGWLLAIALFAAAAFASRAGLRRAGDTRFLAGWSASKGWTAPSFEVRFLNRPDGHATLESLVQHAGTYGYRLETGPAANPADRFLRARLVRDGDAPA